jgi:hypothetical protein
VLVLLLVADPAVQRPDPAATLLLVVDRPNPAVDRPDPAAAALQPWMDSAGLSRVFSLFLFF